MMWRLLRVVEKSKLWRKRALICVHSVIDALIEKAIDEDKDTVKE